MAIPRSVRLSFSLSFLVFSSAGTTGVYKRNKISRYFTDIQVVRQHGFINENRFETAAQLMLGVSPDFFPAIL